MPLRVTQPFGDYQVGDEISDTKVIEQLIAEGRLFGSAVRVQDAPPDAPKDAAPTKVGKGEG